jgi:hypothetical protein
MADDTTRVRIQMVDGRHLEARGTLEDVAARLSPASCGPHGFCETADCVNDSASAAAENEPRTATSRSTRMRRTSSIRSTYTTPRERSFELMTRERDHSSRSPPQPR